MRWCWHGLAPSRLHREVLVTFAGLVDNGRDAQDVMLDIDRANTWFGWVTDLQVWDIAIVGIGDSRKPLAPFSRTAVLQGHPIGYSKMYLPC